MKSEATRNGPLHRRGQTIIEFIDQRLTADDHPICFCHSPPLKHRNDRLSRLYPTETFKLEIKMPNRTLQRLLLSQKGRCFFCNKTLPQADASIEHLVASSNGGRTQDDNCVACCKTINALLGSKPLKKKIRFLLNRNGKCPNGTRRKVNKTVPEASAKVTKLPPKCYTEVVANLKKRGSAKPGTVRALKNSIFTSFPKLSPGQIDVLVQELKSGGEISVEGSKVMYR